MYNIELEVRWNCLSTYEQRLKAFAESISFQIPTEEEVDTVYQTFINNGSHKVDRFINDNGESNMQSMNNRRKPSPLHRIRIF